MSETEDFDDTKQCYCGAWLCTECGCCPFDDPDGNGCSCPNRDKALENQ